MNIKSKLQLEKRRPAIAPLTEGDAYRQQLKNISQMIASRAFELFAQCGYQDGHDLQDWLTAEAELFRKVPCEIAEKGNEIMVRVEVPGFSERDLNVKVEADRIYITGHKEKIVQFSVEGVATDERDYRDIFRTLMLPAKVTPDKATANLHEGVLTIFVPKEAAPKTKQAVA